MGDLTFGTGNFRLQVINYTDIEKNIRELAKMVPGGEIADALVEGAWQFVIQAIQNAHAQGLYKRGNLVRAIRPRKINQYRVDVIVDIVYGAAHEFGLPQQVITDKQRRFFWAMYANTGEKMWKALALSTTYTIPARPYARPAIRNRATQARAARVAGADLAARIARRVRAS